MAPFLSSRRGLADPAAPVRPWLRGQLRVLADEIAIPAVAAIAVAMLQGSPSSLPKKVSGRFIATSEARISAALALATAEHELTAATDPQDALALLVGPLLHRICMQHGTVSDDLLDRLIDSIGTWHSPQGGPTDDSISGLRERRQ